MDYQPQPYIYASEVGQNPLPTPPQNWFVSHKALLIKIGAAVLVLLVVGLIVLFLVNRLRANHAAQIAEVAKETAAVSDAQKECDQTRNPEKCNASVAADLAQSTGKVSFCNELTAEAYDNCVGLAALTSKSLIACQQIKDQEKETACANAVDALLHPAVLEVDAETQAAIDAHNPDGCLAMTDETKREICLELVGVPDRDLDGLNQEEEITLGSSDTNIDSDADGLSDTDEVNIWKTNPAKADTDGDSYSDGVEVKAGYNPLGT